MELAASRLQAPMAWEIYQFCRRMQADVSPHVSRQRMSMGMAEADLICADQDGVTVLTNNGSGGFVIASLCKGELGNFTTSICAADVNGDGKVDLICAHEGNFNLTVLTNDGGGGFALASKLEDSVSLLHLRGGSQRGRQGRFDQREPD